MQPTKLRLQLPFCLLSLSLLSSSVAVPSLAAELRAGFARIDITPTQPVMLEGYASRKELSRDVHDPLFARAVAFEQDRQRLVLVAVENCGFYNSTAEPLRSAVLKASGLKPSELFLCATHPQRAGVGIGQPEEPHKQRAIYSMAGRQTGGRGEPGNREPGSD